MNKKVMSLALVLGLAVTSTVSVIADPLTDKLNSQKSQMQQDQSSLNTIQKQRSDLESNIEKMDNQIEDLIKKIDNTKKKIDVTQKGIKVAEQDVEKAQDDIKGEQDLFNQRMRAMYINGTDSYLDVILNSKNLSDFFSNVEAVRKIIELDKKVISDLNSKKEVLAKKKEALVNENNKLVALKADNEKSLGDLNAKKADQNKLIANLKSQEAVYASKIGQSKAQIDATMKQIQQIRAAAPKIKISRGGSVSTPYSTNSVVAYATNFLNIPYQWGASGPNSFDCSGFTSTVYSHFGINIGRTTYDQVTEGTSVSANDLQAGDLVFFGDPSAPHHVGIYVGNGCYIHAPRTGDVIKISDLGSRSDFSAARRIK